MEPLCSFCSSKGSLAEQSTCSTFFLRPCEMFGSLILPAHRGLILLKLRPAVVAFTFVLAATVFAQQPSTAKPAQRAQSGAAQISGAAAPTAQRSDDEKRTYRRAMEEADQKI